MRLNKFQLFVSSGPTFFFEFLQCYVPPATKFRNQYICATSKYQTYVGVWFNQAKTIKYSSLDWPKPKLSLISTKLHFLKLRSKWRRNRATQSELELAPWLSKKKMNKLEFMLYLYIFQVDKKYAIETLVSQITRLASHSSQVLKYSNLATFNLTVNQ